VFNLIATTYRGLERQARREIQNLLSTLGDPSPKAVTTSVAGLITAQTTLDPFEAVTRIMKKYSEDPLSIQYLIRVIPVEAVVNTDINEMAGIVERLAPKIAVDETFRITVEKRRTSIHSGDIIKAVAQRVERRVSLENPDWVILIEVIGGVTGISVLRPSQIFHALKPRETV
jgi:tRNA acetyltransferase TAN1